MASAPDHRRREELKRAFKEKPPPAGVYAVRCTANGKVLLGASRNARGSLNGIRFQLEQRVYRTHPGLQADWDRFGAERFVFEVLDVLEPKEDADPVEELAALEGLWLEKLRPFGEAGYNVPPAP